MSETEGSSPRELFIEELAEVKGGSANPLEKIREWLYTTYGPCEEGPDGAC